MLFEVQKKLEKRKLN